MRAIGLRLMLVLSVSTLSLFVYACLLDNDTRMLSVPKLVGRLDGAQPLAHDIPYRSGRESNVSPDRHISRNFSSILHTHPHSDPELRIQSTADFSWTKNTLLIRVSGSVNKESLNLLQKQGRLEICIYLKSISNPLELAAIYSSTETKRDSQACLFQESDPESITPCEVNGQIKWKANCFQLDAEIPFRMIGVLSKLGSLLDVAIDLNAQTNLKASTSSLWHANVLGNRRVAPRLRLAELASMPITQSIDCSVSMSFGKPKAATNVISEERINRDIGVTVSNIRRRSIFTLDYDLKVSNIPKTIKVYDEQNNALFIKDHNVSKKGQVVFSIPDKGRFPEYLTVVVDEVAVARVTPVERVGVPDTFRRLVNPAIRFDYYRFFANELPRPIILNRKNLGAQLGPYRLNTTYYDKAFQPVESSVKPGRYGAVTRLKTKLGGEFIAEATLFRLKAAAEASGKNLTVHWPGISSAQQHAIIELAKYEGFLNSTNDPYGAFDFNRRWWHKLRRQVAIESRYIITLPKQYEHSSVQRWPVIIYCHGGGAQDEDILEQRLASETFTKVVQGGLGPFSSLGSKRLQLNCIVVEPLLDMRELRWGASLLESILISVEKKYRIDRKLVLLTGFSSGASGAWRALQERPDMFCGFIGVGPSIPRTSNPWKVKGVPILIFRGTRDEVVKKESLKELYDKVRKGAGDIAIIDIAGADHVTADAVWSQADLWTWVEKLFTSTAKGKTGKTLWFKS